MMFAIPSFLSAVLLAHLLGGATADTLYPIEASLSGSIGGARVDSAEPFQLSVNSHENGIEFEVWADADPERSAMVSVSLDLRALQAGEAHHTALIARSGADPWNWAFEKRAQLARSRVLPLGPFRTLLLVDAELPDGQRVHAEIELSTKPG